MFMVSAVTTATVKQVPNNVSGLLKGRSKLISQPFVESNISVVR